MMDFVRRYEIWVFLVAIVVVNAIFVGAIDAGILPAGLYGFGRFLLLGGVLFALVFFLRGVEGMVELLRPMLKWRVAPAWYLVAIVWGAGNMILFLIGKGLFTGNGLAEVTANLGIVSQPRVQVTIFVSSFIGEIVWISYAVGKLSERFTPYVAALITGVFWTLWWGPMWVLNFGIIPDLPFLALLINQTAVAVVAGFLYWHTRSGLVVLIGQMLFNASLLVFPVVPSNGGIATYSAFAVVYFLTALALFLVKGPKPLFRRDTPVRAMA
jgi:membrane protease YdiL (CAAX protease family)